MSSTASQTNITEKFTAAEDIIKGEVLRVDENNQVVPVASGRVEFKDGIMRELSISQLTASTDRFMLSFIDAELNGKIAIANLVDQGNFTFGAEVGFDTNVNEIKSARISQLLELLL